MSKATFLTIFVVLMFSPALSKEPDIASISALIENSSRCDQKAFEIEGEFIGEIISSQNDGFWLNLSQDGVPIGVFCKNSMMKDAINLRGGRYGRIGDILKIKGTLQRICSNHGGELDFHAETILVIRPARELPESLSLIDFRALVWIAIACLAVLIRKIKTAFA